MITLILPCEKYLLSYKEANDESTQNHETRYVFTDPERCDIFEKFDAYRHERDLKPGKVGADYYWLVDDQRNYFIGEICIRHKLTEELLRYGGHIGYGIRHAEWNMGYGTLMLQLALKKAAALGISRVLITCDDDNFASARVMEKNGLILQDKIHHTIAGKDVITRRYIKEL